MECPLGDSDNCVGMNTYFIYSLKNYPIYLRVRLLFKCGGKNIISYLTQKLELSYLFFFFSFFFLSE